VQRRFEIGIRMALGSTPRRIVRLMSWRSVAPVATGIPLGLVGTIATARLRSAILFGVDPFDPVTFSSQRCRSWSAASSQQSCPRGARRKSIRSSRCDLNK